MLAVRKTDAEFGISLDNIQTPAKPGPDEVLIKVEAAGICGSDVHIYEWTKGYEFMQSRFPLVLGHEFSGRVVAYGEKVNDLTIGDPVVVMPGVSCMRCSACLRGDPHLCLQKETLGLSRDGAFASYVLAPALGCLKLPSELDLKLASLIEPLCVGDNAAEVGEVTFGDTVVVLGPGTIGQAIIRSARWRGASRVIAVGMNDAPRLKVAEEMGATHVIDLAKISSLEVGVRQIMGGMPVDVVIEATGHPSSVSDGLGVLKKGGILVTAGIHSKHVNFDLTSMIRNKQQLRGAHGSTRRGWEKMINTIVDREEEIRPMISLELSLKDAEEGFERCLQREVSKVILLPDSH